MPARLAITDSSLNAADGLQARIHDPLWMLTRQWQMGELAGEDAGSPVGATMTVDTGELGLLRLGTVEGGASVTVFDGSSCPLEASVEAEAWDTRSHPHFRLSAEIGLNFEALLRAAALDASVEILRAAFRLSRPPKSTAQQPTARYVRVMAGRVTDGAALFRRLYPLTNGPGTLVFPDEPPFSDLAVQRQAVQACADGWLQDCIRSFGASLAIGGDAGSSKAWQRSRLEYAFALGFTLGDGAHAISAAEHFEGAIDWYSFDSTVAADMASDRSVVSTHTFLPTAVQFPGAPNDRYWELEDATVNLPKASLLRRDQDTGRLDPASELFIDFVLRFGTDWFSVPLRLPAGSVSRITSLVVVNAFGDRLRVKHTSAGKAGASWRMYAVSPEDSGLATSGPNVADDWFVLPASLGHVIDGAPVEAISFVRDEMANLAWAIEGTTESETGQAIDRAGQYARFAAARTPPSNDADAVPRYLLGSVVPDFWIPLLPAKGGSGGATLRRGAVPQIVDGAIVGGLAAAGRILEPWAPLDIFEEEVPREGVAVTRRYRLARAADGSTHVWMGRLKQPAKGESSSGLRFDTLEPMPGSKSL